MRRKIRMLISTLAVASLFVIASTGSLFAEKITLNVWGWDVIADMIEIYREGFSELYPDIKIEDTMLESGLLYDNLLLALSAGEGAPDISWMGIRRLSQFVALGGLYDITDKALPYYDKMDSWVDAADEKGRLYYMPCGLGPVAVYYRRDVFEQAGLPSDPESVGELLDTYDDFYEVAKLIKDRTGSYMFPQAKANDHFHLYKTLLWQQEAGYVDREGKVVIDSPKAVRTLEYLGKFWKEDLAQDAVGWSAGWYAGIDEGKVATVINASWLATYLKSYISPETSGKWGVVPLPIWEEGDARSSNRGGSGPVITEQSKYKEAAWKLVEYATTNREVVMEIWEKLDLMPSLLASYTDPFVEEPDPYFGGQKQRKVFVQAARHIPWFSYTKDYSEMQGVLKAYLTAYALGEEESAKEALTQAAAEIRARTGRE